MRLKIFTTKCVSRWSVAIAIRLFVVVAIFAANFPLIGLAEPVGQESSSAQSEASKVVVDDFLQMYCLGCHDTGSNEGEREFESFSLPLRDHAGLISADEIIDQVTLKQMPPLDAEQPTSEERLALLTALRGGIDRARETLSNNTGRTVMRRLSNREYENTLSDLFDRRVDTLGLTKDFPKDSTDHHLDTVGQSLVTSGFLLDQYFAAASRLVDARLAKPDTPPRTWHFEDNFVQYEELGGAHRSYFKFKTLAIYEQPDTDTRQGGYGTIEDFLDGVPVSGRYTVQALSQAKHRDTHYDHSIFNIDFSEPFRLAVVPGDVKVGHIHYPQAIEPILDSSIVPDDHPQWLTFDVWLEAGQTPRFIFPNGPSESRDSIMKINQKYGKDFSKDQTGAGIRREHILREGALPRIEIQQVKVTGPLTEPNGGREEVAVFGKQGFTAKKAIDQLQQFAERAYRRPLRSSDRETLKRFHQARLDSGASPRLAALDTVTMILCSPSFYYLSEITPPGQVELDPFDLASRLSYALIAGPPDALLWQAASDGTLVQDEELREQIDRLLDHPKSERFIEGFLAGWLNLREIGNQPPPRSSELLYYSEDWPTSMKQEAYAFFRGLLDQDGPITDFLDCDYAYVDKKLAKLYDLPEAESMRLADGIVKVELAEKANRGGLLGMAAIQTVSANGVDTSPVTRGVWVLENLLGTTPPPPPDEVPDLDNDVRGAKTIRERLAKHSADDTCFVCHRNIDPMGYGLETFDPVGRYRDRYPRPYGKKGPVVDSTGAFPSGESYEDFASFKNVLVKHRSDLFRRSLIETLLMYASGRRLEAADRYEINEIVEAVRDADEGLRTLVTEVLMSEIVRSR